MADQPVLSPGDLAMFDDSGASIGCIVPVGKQRYPLLHGLAPHGQRFPGRTHWASRSATAGTAVRALFADSRSVPLDETDPYTISYPWVMQENGLFRMWYGSNIAWGPEKRDMRHLIKYAESDDGIHWRRDNTIAIDFGGARRIRDLQAVRRQRRDGVTGCGFVLAAKAYRIFEAHSDDGIIWRRLPGLALDVTPGAWDSDMVEYPFVFDHGGQRFMLYAGNTFGKTGFGMAVQER